MCFGTFVFILHCMRAFFSVPILMRSSLPFLLFILVHLFRYVLILSLFRYNLLYPSPWLLSIRTTAGCDMSLVFCYSVLEQSCVTIVSSGIPSSPVLLQQICSYAHSCDQLARVVQNGHQCLLGICFSH